MRRTILLSGVRFLTEALTFIVFRFLIFLFVSESDPAFGEVVGRHLNSHFVAGKNLDVVHSHLARDVGGDFMTVFKFYTEHSVGERLYNHAIDFNRCLFCQILFC